MNIRSIETRHCDAAWRRYHFVKVSTDDGVVGWSEYDEHQGATGITTVIEALAPRLVGQSVLATERRSGPKFASGGSKPSKPTSSTSAVGGRAPGFGSPFRPDLNIDRALLRALRRYLEAFREGAGDDVGILLDLNFNARPEGYIAILRALEDFELFWVEIDTPHAPALADIRRASPHPISSCETLITSEAFLPFFALQAMDVAIIDAVWNGIWQSMKIAALAAAHQINVAPHNYYGHLATLMNAHMAAAIPNLRIMETDVDRIPWDDELVTRVPEIEGSELLLPDAPGWGTEPDEAALARHPVD